MAQINLEMADLTGADLTNADLTEGYVTGAVLNGPKGALTKIDNTDWTDAQLCAARSSRTALLASSRPRRVDGCVLPSDAALPHIPLKIFKFSGHY